MITSPLPLSLLLKWSHSTASLLQAVLSISLLDYLSTYWSQRERDRILIIASFGASAVLVHSAVKSPLAQPRNLVLGHVVSAITGVTVYKVGIEKERDKATHPNSIVCID